MEKKIEELMKKYKCTREEAISIIEEDEEIDGMTVGEINRSYSEEERKAIAENTRSSKGTKAKSDKPREKKIDEDKVFIIEEIFKALGFAENAKIANAQKEITFNFKDGDYSISLIKHRKAKG